MNYINAILFYLFLIIGLTSFCLIWTSFEPIQNKIKLLYNLQGKIWHLIPKVLTCTKCFSIWFSSIFLSITHPELSIYELSSISCLVSLISDYLSFYTNRTKI